MVGRTVKCRKIDYMWIRTPYSPTYVGIALRNRLLKLGTVSWAMDENHRIRRQYDLYTAVYGVFTVIYDSLI